jgi:catechol 2,3-dioxygenase
MKLSHVGITTTDPDGLAEFYTRFLGLRRVARVSTEETGDMVILSGRPQDEPQELALMSNPRARHVAFEVDSLAELRDLYAAAPDRGARVLFGLDHGSTISFYVLDPEGNGCEVTWRTGRPPTGTNRPIDLSRPEEEILQPAGA